MTTYSFTVRLSEAEVTLVSRALRDLQAKLQSNPGTIPSGVVPQQLGMLDDILFRLTENPETASQYYPATAAPKPDAE